MPFSKKEKQQITVIENNLRQYREYKTGLINLQKKLDYIMPNITASYDLAEGSTGTFNIKSDTEKVALDRIESRQALDIHETMEEYKLKVEAIEAALNELDDLEQRFVKMRYFNRASIQYTSIELNASEDSIFRLRNRVLEKFLVSLRVLVHF